MIMKPCLWFNKNAHEAAEFYASVLPNTRIHNQEAAAADFPDGKRGDLLILELTLVGIEVTFLNAGPHFTFNESISFQLFCDDQAELDSFYEALSAHPENEQCGWVKDKFGLSWQLIPRRYVEIMKEAEPAARERVMKAMLGMKRLNLAALEAAPNRPNGPPM